MLPSLLQDPMNRLSFLIRDRVLGRLRLRAGLPDPRKFRALFPGERDFYRLLLQRGLEQRSLPGIATAWDIGCRNWSYADAIADAFPKARLIGVELDGGVRYSDLYRRKDVAESFVSELRARGRSSECRYGDFRAQDVARADGPSAICFFFPFVSEAPCLGWGLPSKFADFPALLRHALGAGEDTLLLSAHQGEWEAELAREAYGSCGRAWKEAVVAADEFRGLWPGKHDVHVLVSRP